ncbi:MAG: O-antigen ligase family protein [Sphingomonas taxi]
MLLIVLLVAGGASRSDVWGQVLVRLTAFVALAVVFLFADRRMIHRSGAVPWLLGAVVILPLIQLLPLPFELWRTLPGRDAVLQTLPDYAQGGLWRPLSLSPGDTVNAAFSLVVPVAVFALLSWLRPTERRLLPFALLTLVVLSMTIGLLQFTGLNVEQRLINYSTDIRGTFANRNHFALFLSLGCLVTPYAALSDSRSRRWLGIAAVGLLLLLALTVLASGSRMGLVLTVIAIGTGTLAMRERLARMARRRLRPGQIALIAGVALVAGSVLLASVYLNRATSIQRLSGADVGQDMRVRALPTVMAMVRTYMPVGSGLGSFDPVFRMHEPFELLKPTYFNRVHDDILEVALDAGVPGILVMVAAALWWARASWRVWRRHTATRPTDSIALARIGSAAIALTVLASIVDYPARTPIIMAVVVVAAAMLAWGTEDGEATARDGRRPELA